MTDLHALARSLDEHDPLADARAQFCDAPGVTAYLDGNSLGRPLTATGDRIAAFLRDDWGTRLIRSWDERWMALPTELGDRIGRLCLGAAPGQTVVADSTSVLLYKLIRAAVAAQPGRDEIVIERANFPTDRFVAEGIAAEQHVTVKWIDADPVLGVQPEDVRAAVHDRTAVVVLSHVDYRSGALAEAAAITAVTHDAGALMLWDLCHSVGVIPVELDAWGADLAVGCTYKYLNGGPGAPALAYLNARHHGVLRQPIWGWMGAADVFAMGAAYSPAGDVRQLLSGTPPVLGMLAMQDMVDLIERAGIDRIRAKSITLTDLLVQAVESELIPLGVRLLSPSDADRRGSHVSIGHARFADVTATLWGEGVIPDFRRPDGIRLGASPLSTSHVEALSAVIAVRDALQTEPAR